MRVLWLLWVVLGALCAGPAHSSSVIVYGATGGGVISAIAASRTLRQLSSAPGEGAGSVVLLSVNKHVGGMVTGGLQHTDCANATVIGGITREYFERVEKEYPGRNTSAYYPPGHSPPGWLAESHVKERVMIQMLKEANVTVVYGVVGIKSVEWSYESKSEVVRVETVVGRSFAGTVFVDGSYEGDLAYKAGVEMTWGREGSAQYNESHAGRQLGIKPDGLTIEPYWDSRTKGGAIPHVYDGKVAGIGDPDNWVEVYDFRLCFTDSPSHRIPISKPESYNRSEWEYWRRLYRQKPPRNLREAGLSCLGPIPHNYSDCGKPGCRKCDMLGMDHGTDMTNGAWAYPNGTIAERQQIWKAHVEYTRGLLWFWATDDSVPKEVRDEINGFGHCNDEYDADSDPPHWPHQLYIREARRMVSDFVWTEHSPAPSVLRRSIGLGSYSFDSHVVSRIIHNRSFVVHEGRVNAPFPGVVQAPFEIPWDVIAPKRREVLNLLVPVAVSATHIRFNAIRMEPTWMLMGHAAGVAAAVAMAHHKGDVHAVDIAGLQSLLVQQKQKLHS